MAENDLRRRYFDAAHAVLAAEGYGALKQARVCSDLGVTTGSFYYTFKNWEEFTVALLTDWHRERTTLLIELARRKKDPLEVLEALLESTLELQHGSEAAIRVWAGADPYVASIQLAVDEERYEVAHYAFKKLVGAKLADRYAWWGINTLVGYEQASYRQTLDDLKWQLDQVIGQAAAVSEERRAATAARRGSRREAS